MIGKVPSSAFGIVLLTPDDMGYLKDEKPEDAKPRARQNVILEMGMLLSSLTRKRCAILQKGFVEQPSNMGGIVYIPFNDHVREAVPKLVQRLQEAGFNPDFSQGDGVLSGDCENPKRDQTFTRSLRSRLERQGVFLRPPGQRPPGLVRC